LNNQRSQAIDGEAKAKPEMIKLGLDLHVRQVTECRQLDGSTPKAARQWDPRKLLDQVKDWVKDGIKVYSCCEAGACGYWYHRELIKAGAVNFVVVPRVLENQRSKHQKTDRLDARALLDRLESYLKGNRHAMSIVAVPSLQEEQQRSVVRYREQLMRLFRTESKTETVIKPRLDPQALAADCAPAPAERLTVNAERPPLRLRVLRGDDRT
jgi:transposase